MNPSRTIFGRTLCALGAMLVAFSAAAEAAADWQVIKVGRWDYLSVDNVANFYGFEPAAPIEKTIRLDNGRNQLELTLDSREAVVNGVRTWLCFPVIAHTDGKYLVSRIDLAKSIEPQLRPQMIANLGKLKTVVIDPGHGGVEKGATNVYGMEKDFALDVARQLKPMLEAKGLRVVMTRETDIQVSLPERARIANATKDSILVSIHFNAAGSHASGFEIFSLTPRGAPSTSDNVLQAKFAHQQAGSPVDAASLALSMSVYHSMLGYLPEFDRGIKRARFAVLRLSKIPSILVEGGFITERQQSQLIANREWRGRLAQSISVGVENYRRLVETRQRPLLLADYRRQFDGGALVARNATAPGPSVAPAIVPASNQQPPPGNYQATASLRREPAPVQVPENALADTPAAAGAPPPEVTAAVAQQDEETPSAPAPDAAQPDAGDLPPTPDEGAPSAEVTPAAAVAAAPPQAPRESPAPAASPAEQQVRKPWFLRFDPPPKFRQ